MLVHVFRHGIAVERDDPKCPEEPARFLTDKGHRRTMLAAQGLAYLALEIDGVIVSPFVRAQQTADIVIDVLGLSAYPRLETPMLLPNGAAALACEFIEDSGLKAPLLVGHAPNLDWVLAYLVGAHQPVTALKKAGFATVEGLGAGYGLGRLTAVYSPSMLRGLTELMA